MDPRMRILSTVALLLLAAAPQARAQTPELRFPLEPQSPRDVDPGISSLLRLDAQRAAQLLPLSRVVLREVRLPDGSVLDLALERVRVETSQLELRVDGQPATWSTTALASLWRGSAL